MIYTDRNKLTVIKLSEKRLSVKFEELEEILYERPSNVVYIELKEMLYGIISSGDIMKASKEWKREVLINKNLLLYIKENIYKQEIYLRKEETSMLYQ